VIPIKFIEKYKYGGWENCIYLSNEKIELVITTDVGPRIIRFGFVGEQNLFKEFSEQLGKTGGNAWRIYGGHRLWHAPEGKLRSYFPDNSLLKYNWDGKILKLSQDVEGTTKVQKVIEITLDPTNCMVEITHRIINRNLWNIKLAPWAITVMEIGGHAIIPQEPYRTWEEYILPVRSVVLWAYTDMSDPRWTWGRKYIQLKQDPKIKTRQKIGVMNTLGWIAYYLNGNLFVKRSKYDSNAEYADFGCNMEVYTDSDILEIETLGGLEGIPPDGSVTHKENWFLFRSKLEDSENSINKNLRPLIKEIESIDY